MLQRIRAYLKNSGGNIAVTFALALVPLVLTAGSAIDFMRFSDARSRIQSALDGAALAAALPVDMDDARRVAAAKKSFQQNLADISAKLPDIKVEITADTVVASIDAAVETSFMRLAGVNTLAVDASSEVMRPFAGQAEIAMVLDYSLSMENNSKYIRMAAAAAKMIDTLDASMDDGKLRIGLVPFSSMVLASMDATYVTQASAASTWTSCTQDRRYPNNQDVATPGGDNATKWGYFDNSKENTGKYDCGAYQSKGLQILPLTDNLAEVKTRLAAMRPLGNTNIPLGAEFGWNLLDPAAPYTEALPYSNSKNRKFLILLTDGVQTSKQWGPGNARSVAAGGTNLLALCEGMREAKITVFTIAYDITDPAVTTLLSECSPGRYYEPDVSNSEISQVFSQITKQIKNKTARLSR